MSDGPEIGKTRDDSTPWWPDPPKPPEGAPNVLVVVFDDVGFSDFGCYGSPIQTPTIDGLAAGGLQYTGFHTTAMCSTTRASLLTGRNHHSVGVGCLANFDSGFPGYRGKIAPEAGTLAEMLRPHGYRNYMVGKWHVTPLNESGATGPFDGWPLGRGFDRYYGFMDAETDHYAPELVRDNTHIDPPGDHASGYHLTEDLADQSIRFLAEHQAARPGDPWFLWLAFGACHAPHQAPPDLIAKYDVVFRDGWDEERERRLKQQKEMGVVPRNTRMPARNDSVKAWGDHSPEEQAVFTRLQAAYAAMLDHADQHLARVVEALERSGTREDTLILLLSDNGASQEGGPQGFVNAMGPFNFKPEPIEEKFARIEDIGGPDTHSNFPWGWAMAANTPLRRYKQNTHGGGIRDPLIVNWPAKIKSGGELRHQFAHVSDVTPTVLDLIGIAPPTHIGGFEQQPVEGTSFASSILDASAPSRSAPQYFEMFGHRGIWHDGWKAVAFHAPGTPFESDQWELFNLGADFSETDDLADREPERLAALLRLWWEEAEKYKVLPLDDRFGPRFAENAARLQGSRKQFVFHAGMGHVPSDVAPDVRSRDYRIEAEVTIPAGGAKGVLIAHGDSTSGYSLYLKEGRLVHDLNIGGEHLVLTSDRPVPVGDHRLGLRRRRTDSGLNAYTLTMDGEPAGSLDTQRGFVLMVSWAGLDIGRDRGNPVSSYASPFEFTGELRKVTVTMDDDQQLDGDGIGRAELARE